MNYYSDNRFLKVKIVSKCTPAIAMDGIQIQSKYKIKISLQNKCGKFCQRNFNTYGAEMAQQQMAWQNCA
jgi:hypothetical protein